MLNVETQAAVQEFCLNEILFKIGNNTKDMYQDYKFDQPFGVNCHYIKVFEIW